MIAIEPAGERAEVAIAVRADYKHQGVGWTLLNRAADYAKTRGCRTLEAVESRLNKKAIEAERDSGFTVKAYPDDANLVIVSKQPQCLIDHGTFRSADRCVRKEFFSPVSSLWVP